MPTLVLPPRFTEDSSLLWKAAIDSGWRVERLQGWQAPAELAGAETAVYGEPLFVAAVAACMSRPSHAG